LSDVQLHNNALYFAISAASVIVFIIALGPGLFNNAGAQEFSWQYRGFELLCHQLRDRSYQISGTPMAVCSRCIGIYGAFMVAWLSLPLLSKIRISYKAKIGWLIGVIILNLGDVFGNFFNLWSNTLNSRLLLGILLGISVALLFNNDFYSLKKRMDYGK